MPIMIEIDNTFYASRQFLWNVKTLLVSQSMAQNIFGIALKFKLSQLIMVILWQCLKDIQKKFANKIEVW